MGIIFNPLTGQFDFTGSGDTSGLQAQIDSLNDRVNDVETEIAEFSKETVLFTTSDFVLVVDQYIFTVTAITHEKNNPTVTVYEENGANFDEVTASIKILANKDVQLIVPQTPDLRFNGKLIIL